MSRKWFRLIAINLVVLVGIWMALLFILSVGSDVIRVAGDVSPRKPDQRALLPSYDNPDLAVEIYRNESRSGRHFIPFIGWRSRPLNSSTIHIDENGFRTHEVLGERSTDAKTIGFFGGSAMWGTGSDDDHTIPACFDRMTGEYEVRNYADLGWVSRQNLAQLINEANQGRAPDVAVFYDGYNDVRILCNRAFTESLNGTALEGRFRSIIERRKSGARAYRYLILPFIELLAPQHSGDPEEQYVCDKDPEMAEKVAGVLVRNWSIAAEIVEDRGGSFFGFLQPSAFSGNPRLDHLPEDVNADWRNREAVQRQFDAVYPILRAKLRASGLAWKDLTDAFDGDEYYYVDTSHVAPPGNVRIARQMLDFIEETSGSTQMQ